MQAGRSVCELLTRKSEITPQYLKMKKDPNPMFIWGCGAFAVRVYHYCRNYEIPVAGFFVNVPEEKTEFEGLPVYRIEQLIASHPKFSVIIGHANYTFGTAWLKRIATVQNVYCITSCCYDIWNPISEAFLAEHEGTLNEFYSRLSDEASRRCFLSYFESRINDDPFYMFPCYKNEIGYYQNDVFALGNNETLLDIGACVGNSIWPFVEAVEGAYHTIIALEPDEDNCLLLQDRILERSLQNVIVKQVCAYEKEGFVKFSGEQEQGGIQEDAGQYRLCPAVTVDRLCKELEADVSLLKINFPFSVPQILQGAKELLRKQRPKMIVRAGFDENVLLETYRTIRLLNPDYRIYLRYTVGIPQGLTIFAI